MLMSQLTPRGGWSEHLAPTPLVVGSRLGFFLSTLGNPATRQQHPSFVREPVDTNRDRFVRRFQSFVPITCRPDEGAKQPDTNNKKENQPEFHAIHGLILSRSPPSFFSLCSVVHLVNRCPGRRPEAKWRALLRHCLPKISKSQRAWGLSVDHNADFTFAYCPGTREPGAELTTALTA